MLVEAWRELESWKERWNIHSFKKEARIDQDLSVGVRFLFRRDVSKLLGIVVFATICIVLFYLSIGDILDYILNYEQNKDPLDRLEI